ncbi:MAG TPA: polyprenyl diphosphate synthase [Candidatus Saccharimonadales bacterium]|nr:polyprenyl diphosphate synthase [Candidatus Saccharimonadales bacterium]
MDEDQITIPKHIGFILDGNRRWAKKHSLPEYDGHLAGYNALKEVMDGCFERDIKYVTIYAFSNENWKRDKGEVSGLMKLALHAIAKDLKRLIERNVRVRILGRRDGIEAKLLAGFEKVEDKTRHLTGGTLAVCFNYGGQQEIIDATKRCIDDGLSSDQINEDALASRLYCPDVPPIDLVVRTSGEERLSNFMLWRIAYSEFLFLEKLWPEMTKADVDDIIEEYNRRSRRFGG